MRICGLLALTALVVALAASGGATRSAEAAFPGQNGKIAFVKTGQVWVANGDGSDQRPLAEAPSTDPAWSPDGGRIAFNRGRDIWVMNADGSAQTRLTTDSAEDRAPSWSPDGSRIVFVSLRDHASGELYVMNADGTAQTRITTNTEFDNDPAWSPDGGKIVFEGSNPSPGGDGIFVVDAVGGGRQRLTGTGPGGSELDPEWSPDGTKIAFASNRLLLPDDIGDFEIVVMNADGSGQRNVTNRPSTEDYEPAWSPDGTKIAFGAGKIGSEDVFVMNADGSGQTLVVGIPGQASTALDWQPLAFGPIVVTGGAEASDLEVKVDAGPGGFTYTFTDVAPLQVLDTRCASDPAGAIVCRSLAALPVTMALGGGDDTLVLTGSHAFAQLTVDGGAGNDTLPASPTARGGEDNDTITGGNCGVATTAECLLEGGTGDDVLTGGTGNDRLRGGTGSDELAGNFGRDSADYSDFTETVLAELDAGSEEPEPEQGVDTLAADVEDLVGGAGGDELTGGALSNRIEGLGGDDVFVVLEEVGVDTDELVGGAGRDTVSYGQVLADVTATIGGEGTIVGDPSREAIGADVEVVQGGEGFDTLTGSAAGDEELLGGPGDDELVGEGGADVLDGGEGLDLVTYAGPERVFVNISDEEANDGHEGEGDKLLRVEDVTGGDGNDFLIGNADANRLLGEGGADDLVGGAGFNLLDGGPGDDVLVDDDAGQDAMSGGDGVDTADYSADTLGVIVDPEGGPTVPCNDGAQQHDCVFDDVENIEGGSGDDVLDGTAAANVLTGRGGADELNGLGGNDTLIAGAGGDDVLGGDGDDELQGGEDLDVLAGEAGNDILDAGPGGGTLRGGDGDDELLGGDGDDDLFGGAGADQLLAGVGADALVGDAGADTLDGGLGADEPIDGGADADTLVYADRTRDLAVDPESGGLFAPADDGESGEGDQVLDTVENITGGSGDDTLTGTAGANTLVGNDGKDVLNGLDGPDVLDGGRDADTLLSQDGVRDEDFCGPSFDSVAADLIDNVSVDCEVVTFPVPSAPPPAPPGVNTPPGTNVVVQPTDPATLSQPVTVTFSSVTAPGQTSVVSSPVGPAVPSGFQLGNPPRFYELTTTAQFTPPVTVCLNTTGMTFPGGQPQLFHFENGAWRDVTTSVGPGPQVCGVVNSLSPFAAFSPKRAAKIVRCVVPNVRGKTLPAARKAIVRARCSVGRVRRAHSAKVRIGRVVSQAPRPGTRLRKGTRVTLVLSRGRRK